MRQFLLAAIGAVAIAIALVLVIGEEETEEDIPPPATTQMRPAAPPPPVAAPRPAAPANGHGAGETAGVRRAVELYVEAAETGEVRAPPGLPTTDELSIRRVTVAGNRASAELAGGERLVLRRARGRWRVIRVIQFLSVG